MPVLFGKVKSWATLLLLMARPTSLRPASFKRYGNPSREPQRRLKFQFATQIRSVHLHHQRSKSKWKYFFEWFSDSSADKAQRRAGGALLFLAFVDPGVAGAFSPVAVPIANASTRISASWSDRSFRRSVQSCPARTQWLKLVESANRGVLSSDSRDCRAW